MRAPSLRLRVLLCVAVLGVLALLGLVVAAVAGAGGAVAYAVVVVLLVGAAVARGRAAFAPTRLAPADGAPRTCTCCTTTQHDPVRIV
jgi:hypothetical protein